MVCQNYWETNISIWPLFLVFYWLIHILILPGIGSIGLGAAVGGTVGWAASAIIGTIGVVTGGVGIAIGVIGMTSIGAVLGAIGAGSGGFGIRTTTYFLVTPWFWVPLIFIGLFFMFRGRKSNI